MTTCTGQVMCRPLRVPGEDRSALVDPPFEEAGFLLDGNLRLRAEQDYDFQGRRLADLRRQAREELLSEARHWTRNYRDVGSSSDAAGAIFLAGHQPEVFHPGVWLKNFALGHLARRHGAVAVNLVIDSDTVNDTALRVPGGSVADPRTEEIPLDRPGLRVPYEGRRILDRTLFTTFGRRVAERIAPLVPNPLIEAYWPLALQQMRQTDNLGACLAQSRHRLEGDWGLETLEVPQSRVCETGSFCWFAAHLLARLPQLRGVYNEAVREYRQAHRIRSAAHPVPELSADGPWLEAPLWVYSTEDPRRRPLFARRRGDQTVLSDRKTLEIGLPLGGEGDASRAVERLMGLRRQGVKIRCRALITTLWARLILGDLFLHGIGGAKYDQVTDRVIERFFGLCPPRFMVLSATLHLPVQRSRVTVEQARSVRQQLRQLVYHPEWYIDGGNGERPKKGTGPFCRHGRKGAMHKRDLSPLAAVAAELIAAKARWIRTPQTPQNARIRCRAIRQVNGALQPWVERQRERLEKRLAQTDHALRAESVLTSRQYGFCLYPEETFRAFLLGLLPKNA